MNPKLIGWLELLLAAAFTGALNASANALAAPDIFAHGGAGSILFRMAAVGAILSMRDQMKQSPVSLILNAPAPAPEPAPQIAVNTTAPVSVTAQEVLPRVNTSDNPAVLGK